MRTAARAARSVGVFLLLTGSWLLSPVQADEPSSANAANGAPPSFTVGPAPAWVIDVGVPDNAGVSTDLLHDGVADLLSDAQIRVSDGPEHVFNRYVSAVIEPSGVSSVGRIQIEFAATYQQLELHWIRLVRAGDTQERLDPAKVRLIQQEEDLDIHLYSQHATALVLLDDVRVGDRVDYAYSLVGANPIFQNRYMDWLYLEWWYPFGRIHNRILAPAARPLHFELHQTDEAPTIRRVEGEPGFIEYVWQGDATRAALSEDTTPSDFDPLAAHQVSEFSTWGEVARWASDVFGAADEADETDEAVRALADEIRHARVAPADQIIAALRFVQDEVRYLGLEIGVNAYRPHAPALTLERRFGDCKDKSSLLVALLAELEVEAHVALVNTELGAEVAAYHPTADAFDHAIVRVLYDGRAYWLDPTASYERGPLADEEWFDYGFALIVDPSGDALTAVEPHAADLLPARIEHAYTTEDYGEPTALEVTSTYRGDRADSLRAWAASTALDAIERQYLNYYARDLPGIEMRTKLEMEDDPATNTIVVTERYSVPDLWEWDEERERFKARFVARELRDELSTPDTVQRTHPLATSHPVRTELTIYIDAPERMSVRAREEHIEGPAFKLDYAVRRDHGDVVIDYRYESTADRVAPLDVADHLEAVEAVYSATQYRLGSATNVLRGAGELGMPLFGPHTWLRDGIGLGLLVVGLFFFAWPALLLRGALHCITRGQLERATLLLRIASRFAPSRSALARRIELAISIALCLWGRADEALGTAAKLTRQPASSTAARTVRAGAWAWRAELAANTSAERAAGFADRAVDLARELPGVHGWMALACALSSRAGLHARSGALDAAARDLDEARAHRLDEREPKSGLPALLRTIANTGRAETALACASGDAEAAVSASLAELERLGRETSADHPRTIEARLAHGEALRVAGETSEACRQLDLATTALDERIDIESPLRERADHLRGALAASE